MTLNLYGYSSVLIAVVLFACMMFALEIGYRIGLQRATETSEASRGQVTAIEGALLGFLALILGFAFSLALQRFDRRSEVVVVEANAIGTALLRAQLLHDDVRADTQSLLREYVESRVAENRMSMDRSVERSRELSHSHQLTDALWAQAGRAIAVDDRPATTGLYIQSLNDLIDALTSTETVMARHVPALVFYLLFVTFAATIGSVGMACGMARHRPPPVVHLLAALIVVVTFLIIDLDRPRRGLIRINEQPMLDLLQSVTGGPASAMSTMPLALTRTGRDGKG